MTPFDYLHRFQWPVFPCEWHGPRRKQPLVARGLHAASRDPEQIRTWWARWPHALTGLPTGKPSRVVVLDIDVKNPAANGFDTLKELGYAVLPTTPLVFTASGGAHLYFNPEGHHIPNTNGAQGRGIGPGLDWRGDGGYVIVPSNGSGYAWDHASNFTTLKPASIPAALLPKPPPAAPITPAVRPANGLSPYAAAALDSACHNIVRADAGSQETTLNNECIAIGSLAGAGAIPRDFALDTLLWTARQIPNHDPKRPWAPRELDHKVTRAFNFGLKHPRGATPR